MTKECAEFLKLASNRNNQDVRVISDYSGRGMFGKTTYAVIIDSLPQLFVDTLNFCRENPKVAIPDFYFFRQDNMGYSIVIY